jgi:nucleotide-binding universal stress UspA family protein
MSLSPKTITVFLDASPSGKKRATHAAALAQRWGAHLLGVNVVFAGVELPASMSYARGDEAFKQVSAYKRGLDSGAELAAAQVREHFRAVCARLNVSGEFRPIGRENSTDEAIHIAFHSDLVVVGHPEPHGLPDYLSVEKLLLASGAPLLIVPNAWEGETIGNKILIGWNATREARRAVLDAMAFLVAAESVTLLAIDPDAEHPNGAPRGSDVALCLDRHGAHVDFEQLTSGGFSIPAVLLGYAEQSAADLLVVGAYSHVRLRELLFGGTTRALLRQTPMPTLMSR